MLPGEMHVVTFRNIQFQVVVRYPGANIYPLEVVCNQIAY